MQFDDNYPGKNYMY